MINLDVNQEEVLNQALSNYGEDAQIWVAIEEMAELTNALAKVRRMNSTLEDIREEIADVYVMMQQLAINFGVDNVQSWVNYKINRLATRMRSK